MSPFGIEVKIMEQHGDQLCFYEGNMVLAIEMYYEIGPKKLVASDAKTV